LLDDKIDMRSSPNSKLKPVENIDKRSLETHFTKHGEAG